uniref:Chaperone protein dnaJ 6 n=1 Tax=Arundo donax TaxID=35708 RepID=A0A0A9GE41_ARUDO
MPSLFLAVKQSSQHQESRRGSCSRWRPERRRRPPPRRHRRRRRGKP